MLRFSWHSILAYVLGVGFHAKGRAEVKATIGSVIVEGTPREVAELARELGLHPPKAEPRGDSQGGATNAPPIGGVTPFIQSTLTPPISIEAVLKRIKATDQEAVDALLRQKPSASVHDFLTVLVGIDPEMVLRGRRNPVYTRTYNRLAAARRKLGLLAPSVAKSQKALP